MSRFKELRRAEFERFLEAFSLPGSCYTANSITPKWVGFGQIILFTAANVGKIVWRVVVTLFHFLEVKKREDARLTFSPPRLLPI